MLTLHQLVARAAVLGEARRRKLRSVPSAQPPRGATVAYAQALHAVGREMDDAVASALADEGIPLRADGAADGDVGPVLMPSQIARAKARISAIVDKILARRSLLTPFDAAGLATMAWNREQFARQVKVALGIDLTTDPDLRAQMEAFRRSNIALIRSLATRKVTQVHAILTESGGATRVEDIAARIRSEVSTTPAKAALLARDQVLKLNGAVTAARHQAAGITQYVWRTSKDERVRETHRALEGKRFTYGHPPVVDPKTGRRDEPGQDYQCRCTAEPVIEDLDEPSAPVEREAIRAPRGSDPPANTSVARDLPSDAFDPSPLSRAFGAPHMAEETPPARTLEEQESVRAELRNLTTRVGLQDRDGEKSHHKVIAVAANGTLGAGVIADHDRRTGAITLTASADAHARAALAKCAARQRGALTAPEVDALCAVTHEAIHGAFPSNAATYQGVGRVTNEAAVELAARHTVRAQFGIDHPRLDVSVYPHLPGLRPYDGYIFALRRAVEVATGMTPEAAIEGMTRAALAMGAEGATAGTSPEEHLSRFAAGITFPDALFGDLSAEERTSVEQQLRRRIFREARQSLERALAAGEI